MTSLHDKLGIVADISCAKCVEEHPDLAERAEHTRLVVGLTSTGRMIIICLRHSVEVLSMGAEQIGPWVVAMVSQQKEYRRQILSRN